MERFGELIELFGFGMIGESLRESGIEIAGTTFDRSCAVPVPVPY